MQLQHAYHVRIDCDAPARAHLGDYRLIWRPGMQPPHVIPLSLLCSARFARWRLIIMEAGNVAEVATSLPAGKARATADNDMDGGR